VSMCVQVTHRHPRVRLVLSPVHDQHLVPAFVQLLHYSAADEGGSSQHQHPHALAPLCFWPTGSSSSGMGHCPRSLSATRTLHVVVYFAICDAPVGTRDALTRRLHQRGQGHDMGPHHSLIAGVGLIRLNALDVSTLGHTGIGLFTTRLTNPAQLGASPYSSDRPLGDSSCGSPVVNRRSKAPDRFRNLFTMEYLPVLWTVRRSLGLSQ
jgi:hypothetical protein